MKLAVTVKSSHARTTLTLSLSAIFLCGSIGLTPRALAIQTTISSLNDGELDEHVNWNNSAKGSPGPASPNCYQNGCKFMYAGRLADDYGSPVVGPSKFSVMKFDVSSLAGQTVNSVTLRLIQTFDPSATVAIERTLDSTYRGGMQLAPTTNVYALNSGAVDFDETLDSWRSFTADGDPATDASRNTFLNSGKISQLGTITNAVNAGGILGPGAPVTFSDASLKTLVQGWIDGTVSNLGLLLLNPATLTGAPAGPGDIMARYATHESRESLNGGNPNFGGTSLNWDPPQLIISYGAASLTGDYNNNGSVDAADYALWRNNVGTTATLPNDPVGGTIGSAQYNQWRSNFGAHSGAASALASTAVPEPAAILYILVAAIVGAFESIRHRPSSV